MIPTIKKQLNLLKSKKARAAIREVEDMVEEEAEAEGIMDQTVTTIITTTITMVSSRGSILLLYNPIL